MTAPCPHLEDVPLGPMPDVGCEACIEAGDTWIHLRYCTTCGSTGCCDSSKNQHAHRHADATGHPVVRSKEPGEHWAYCWIDDAAVTTS